MGRKESRKAKAAIMEDLREKAGRAQLGVLTDFTGLKVEVMSQLRRQLKEADGELKVAKNTLLRQSAAGDSLMAPLSDQLAGPNAVAFAYSDPVALAKLLIKFAQEKPLFKIKAGVMGGQVLSVKDIETLSKLPPREVLLAQILGAMQAVPTGLVTVLAGVIRGLLNVLVAIKDQQGGGEDAPAAEAAGGSEA